MSEEFISPSALGSLISQHKRSSSSSRAMTVLGIGWVILLCADVVVSISVFITSFQETQNALSALCVPLICIGVFLLPGAIILYQQWWTGVYAVAFYDRGIALRTRRGIEEIPWQEFDALWLEWAQSGTRYSTRSTLAAYAFRLKNGEKFRLRANLEGFNEFEEKFYKPVMAILGENQTK